ncbi:uncharacterized protein LOC115654057 [Gopherus evgoodei]|uniref:uncharacterized protein LOC115654057 n=1 Tax=Gopherus evgoodei TaxID=1825980 RepID=UPI0011CFD2CE|nr:uncharacterized protein LOC115654057 [Gopherus evgoodei]
MLMKAPSQPTSLCSTAKTKEQKNPARPSEQKNQPRQEKAQGARHDTTEIQAKSKSKLGPRWPAPEPDPEGSWQLVPCPRHGRLSQREAVTTDWTRDIERHKAGQTQTMRPRAGDRVKNLLTPVSHMGREGRKKIASASQTSADFSANNEAKVPLVKGVRQHPRSHATVQPSTGSGLDCNDIWTLGTRGKEPRTLAEGACRDEVLEPSRVET